MYLYNIAVFCWGGESYYMNTAKLNISFILFYLDCKMIGNVFMSLGLCKILLDKIIKFKKKFLNSSNKFGTIFILN